MKRYLAGSLAVIFAIAAAAFTVPSKHSPSAAFTFRYNSPSYTQPDVQTNNNWISGSSSCSGAANKACEMEVLDTYTHLQGSTRVLNTTGNVIVVKAVLGANHTDYVPNPATSTGIQSATDKP